MISKFLYQFDSIRKLDYQVSDAESVILKKTARHMQPESHYTPLLFFYTAHTLFKCFDSIVKLINFKKFFF